jgi:excinuclease UvrABC ATPase subunit
MPERRHRADPKRVLTVTEAVGNNLKNVTLKLP